MQHDVPLNQYSTMRLGGAAEFFTELTSHQDVEDAAEWAEEQALPLLVIGGGSNVIFPDSGIHGIVAINKLMGVTVVDEDDTTVTFTIGSGENWDDFVAKAVAMQLYGVECLSLIPGTVGATPVQNVGAYGQEIADTFVSLEAYDRISHAWVKLDKQQCGFAYRKSIFNSTQKGRYIITAVHLQLFKAPQPRPLYRALQDYLDAKHIKKRDGATIRDAVIAIRSSKLPDPQKIANNGSFFHNAIVSNQKLTQLLANYPEMPHFPAGEQESKIPTAWLIDQVGYKGKRAHGIYVSEKQPLVLINESATSTDELLAMRNEIIAAVKEKFDITIHQEPELVATTPEYHFSKD